MTTPLLGLSEIAEGVANQTTIHNAALRQLEALLVRALSKDAAAPPASPAAGDSYIIPAGATGVWTGREAQIAAFLGGAWSYFAAQEGMRLWINDLDAEYVFDGAAWVPNGGDASADIAAAIAAHEAASDPHPQYLTAAEGNAAYEAAGAVATHAGATDPHPQYMTQAEGDARYASSTAATGVSSVNSQTGAVTLTAADVGALTQTQADARYLQSVPTQPFDLPTFYPGVPTAGAIVTRVVMVRAVTFPAGLTGSMGRGRVAATGSAAFDLQKNGASVGTITFAASATSATFTAASAVTLAAGDILAIIAPATADATLADISITLAGTR